MWLYNVAGDAPAVAHSFIIPSVPVLQSTAGSIPSFVATISFGFQYITLLTIVSYDNISNILSVVPINQPSRISSFQLTLSQLAPFTLYRIMVSSANWHIRPFLLLLYRLLPIFPLPLFAKDDIFPILKKFPFLLLNCYYPLNWIDINYIPFVLHFSFRKITGSTSTGMLPFSNPVSFVSPQGRPSASPTNITLITRASTWLVVSH